MENIAKSLLQHVESGLSLRAKEVIETYNELCLITSKAKMKPKTVVLEDFNSAMVVVDRLNNSCK